VRAIGPALSAQTNRDGRLDLQGLVARIAEMVHAKHALLRT
jgi:hypothetical protein